MLQVPAIIKLRGKIVYKDTCMYLELYKLDKKYFWNMYNELMKYKQGKIKDISYLEHIENTVTKLEELNKIL